MRRTPALLTAGLLGLPLLALPPAQAADPPGSTEVAVVATSGDVQQFTPPGGARTAFGEFHGSVYSLAISRDGSRVVDDEEPLTPSMVMVRDIGGALVRSFTDVNDGSLSDPQLSPNGTRIVFGNPSDDPDSADLTVSDLAGGESQRIPIAGPRYRSDYVFLTQDLLLVKDQGTTGHRYRALGLFGSAGRAISGLATPGDDLSAFTVDPSGTRMAYVRSTGTSRTIEVVAMSLASTDVVFGARRVLAAGAVGAPAFTRDGATVVYVRGGASSADLWSVPATGGAASRFGPATVADELAVVFGAKETSPPGAVGLGRAVLDGQTATIGVRLPADATLSRLHVTRTAPGEQPYEYDVVLPVTSIRAGYGMVVGRAYTFVVQPFDRSGNAGPTATTRLVATAPPLLRTADPTATTSAVSGFPVQLAPAVNAPDTRYSVDSRIQGTTSWSRLVTLTTAASLPSRGTPGQTYAFRGQAYDRFGNATAPEPSLRAVVPFDQQRGSFTGSTVTVARTGAYGGTSTFLRAAGAVVSFRSAGDRLQVIGETCPTCGAFDVYLDGVRKARVDTVAAARSARAVLWTSANQYTNRVRTVVVRAVGTTGRPTVVIDALAARRVGPDGRNSVVTGSSLLVGDRLVSRDGRQALYFSGQLYLGAYSAAKTPTPSGARLTMQKDGNLVIYSRAGTPVFQSRTAGNGPSTLVLQDDGNLVVFRSSDGKALWSTRTGRAS